MGAGAETGAGSEAQQQFDRFAELGIGDVFAEALSLSGGGQTRAGAVGAAAFRAGMMTEALGEGAPSLSLFGGGVSNC
jgi:hypothetical protein